MFCLPGHLRKPESHIRELMRQEMIQHFYGDLIVELREMYNICLRNTTDYSWELDEKMEKIIKMIEGEPIDARRED